MPKRLCIFHAVWPDLKMKEISFCCKSAPRLLCLFCRVQATPWLACWWLIPTAVLVTVSIPAGQPEAAVLNMAGPIIINSQARLGLQVPQCGDGPQQIYMHSLKPVDSEAPAEAGGTAPAE